MGMWRGKEITIGRVKIAYSHALLGIIRAYFPEETYTFADTKKEEGVNVEFPYLEQEGRCCCWKGGDLIPDKWMHDLEIFGFAKSFRVKSSWMVPLGNLDNYSPQQQVTAIP